MLAAHLSLGARRCHSRFAEDHDSLLLRSVGRGKLLRCKQPSGLGLVHSAVTLPRAIPCYILLRPVHKFEVRPLFQMTNRPPELFTIVSETHIS